MQTGSLGNSLKVGTRIGLLGDDDTGGVPLLSHRVLQVLPEVIEGAEVWFI